MSRSPHRRPRPECLHEQTNDKARKHAHIYINRRSRRKSHLTQVDDVKLQDDEEHDDSDDGRSHAQRVLSTRQAAGVGQNDGYPTSRCESNRRTFVRCVIFIVAGHTASSCYLALFPVPFACSAYPLSSVQFSDHQRVDILQQFHGD